jgi:hypothetical protein
MRARSPPNERTKGCPMPQTKRRKPAHGQVPKFKIEPIELRAVRPRCKISRAKFPLLDAIEKVIAELEEFWPVTDRQIHYDLLNDPPLIHASKPDSRYQNDKRSYKAVCELITRARHEGHIPYERIEDETRKDVVWRVYSSLADYYESQRYSLLTGYGRDLMQGQRDHVQIVVEKNTMNGVVRPVAMKYTIPYQIGRGQNTTTPVWKIAMRFKASGKKQLILLVMSDLDPDGDAIAHSLGQRLRDDHGIKNIEVYKVALTMEQIRDLRLPESFTRAKKDSPNYKRYVKRYQTDLVWELESVPPRLLQQLLTQYIEAVIGHVGCKAFDKACEAERADHARNEQVREMVLRTLREQIANRN